MQTTLSPGGRVTGGQRRLSGRASDRTVPIRPRWRRRAAPGGRPAGVAAPLPAVGRRDDWGRGGAACGGRRAAGGAVTAVSGSPVPVPVPPGLSLSLSRHRAEAESNARFPNRRHRVEAESNARFPLTFAQSDDTCRTRGDQRRDRQCFQSPLTPGAQR